MFTPLITLIQKKKGLLLSIAFFLFLLSPALLFAAGVTEEGGIVPCRDNCGFNDLITLVRNIIQFITLYLAIPFSILAFMYAGFLIMTGAGNESKIKEGKDIATHVAIGLVVMLAAWLIIHTITDALLKNSIPFLGN